MKTAVIGSGGREHTIAWKLSQSSIISQIICIPGNGGTATENKCKNISASISDHNAIVKLLKDEGVSFAVIGPEDPLAEGIADKLWENGIPVVGPKKAAAQLEASKDLSKEFMKKYGIACANSETFTDSKKAIDYIKANPGPCAVKADGLAAGKGVVVAPNSEEAIKAVKEFMDDGILGDAGKKLVIEEYLEGTECSILAAVSVTPELAKQGKACIKPFVVARDHKRLNDGAKGPNTGGMGAIAPADGVDEKILDQFNKTILQPTLKGLISENFDYRGFIFFGLMVGKNGPKLLEYNVRLGDPETQAVLPLMDFDFAKMCLATLAINEETLNDFSLTWKDGFVCAPVAVSGGYPRSYAKGKTITIKNDATSSLNEKSKIFIAGAKLDNENLVTSGGRVLAAAAFGKTIDEARTNSYNLMKQISFEGMFYRKDIGMPGSAESKPFDK